MSSSAILGRLEAQLPELFHEVSTRGPSCLQCPSTEPCFACECRRQSAAVFDGLSAMQLIETVKISSLHHNPFPIESVHGYHVAFCRQLCMLRIMELLSRRVIHSLAREGAAASHDSDHVGCLPDEAQPTALVENLGKAGVDLQTCRKVPKVRQCPVTILPLHSTQEQQSGPRGSECVLRRFFQPGESIRVEIHAQHREECEVCWLRQHFSSLRRLHGIEVVG
mmetsp:Transcript_115816/g.368221  ORF Transcript_115816/g.368221 Transcript_115816/m.368221 type:complete len:223 (-) Transcript_115816:2071-2739(-)